MALCAPGEKAVGARTNLPFGVRLSHESLLASGVLQAFQLCGPSPERQTASVREPLRIGTEVPAESVVRIGKILRVNGIRRMDICTKFRLDEV